MTFNPKDWYNKNFTTLVLILPFKFQIKNALLFSNSTYLYINALDNDVKVPKQYKQESALKLKIYKNKYKITQDIIKTIIMFNNTNFECIIPIKSIWAYYLCEL